MKKRWISLLAENEIGVLARIAGLFSGKSYNLNSLTVGRTEDETVSRMTIGLTSDDKTFEQVKKQLNRSVEVIKVTDFTDLPIHRKELMFIRVVNCTGRDMTELFRLSQVYKIRIIDYGPACAVVESVQDEQKNDALVSLFAEIFSGRMQVVRGGSVGVEAANQNVFDKRR